MRLSTRRMSGLLRRLLTTAFVVFGVVTAVFVVQRAVPGDPAEVMLGDQASPEQVALLRGQLGLDAPLLEQYGHLWAGVFDGSLGTSLEARGRRRDVSAILWEHAPATLELGLAGVVIAILIALPLGIAAGLRPWSWIDQSSAVVALVGVAIPNFWLGPLLIHLLAVEHDIFPDPGEALDGLRTLVLPAFVLGTALAAKLTRMVRSSILDEVGAPHVVTARAKGLPGALVVWRHVLRGAMVPVVTVLGLQFASLLTGAIVIEKVFARPGLGTLLLDAVAARNYTVVQGTVIVFALAYIAVNLVTDLVYAWLDPRVRLGGRPGEVSA